MQITTYKKLNFLPEVPVLIQVDDNTGTASYTLPSDSEILAYVKAEYRKEARYIKNRVAEFIEDERKLSDEISEMCEANRRELREHEEMEAF